MNSETNTKVCCSETQWVFFIYYIYYLYIILFGFFSFLIFICMTHEQFVLRKFSSPSVNFHIGVLIYLYTCMYVCSIENSWLLCSISLFICIELFCILFTPLSRLLNYFNKYVFVILSAGMKATQQYFHRKQTNAFCSLWRIAWSKRIIRSNKS